MGQSKSDEKLGRFLSLVLRHNPAAAQITLDEHGWADVKALLAGCARAGRRIDRDTLERIVRENNKQRYSFNDDHTKIRANQGHSIAVDVELRQAQPPAHRESRASRGSMYICPPTVKRRWLSAAATVPLWSLPSTRPLWRGTAMRFTAPKTASGSVSRYRGAMSWRMGWALLHS